jgi:hypothetical protein
MAFTTFAFARERSPHCQPSKIKFEPVRRSPEVPENKGYRHLSGPTESVANDRERSQWQPAWQPENDLGGARSRADTVAIHACARRHNLSADQASYLVLAQQHALPLATADNALAEAIRPAGIQLVDV